MVSGDPSARGCTVSGFIVREVRHRNRKSSTLRRAFLQDSQGVVRGRFDLPPEFFSKLQKNCLVQKAGDFGINVYYFGVCCFSPFHTGSLLGALEFGYRRLVSPSLGGWPPEMRSSRDPWFVPADPPPCCVGPSWHDILERKTRTESKNGGKWEDVLYTSFVGRKIFLGGAEDIGRKLTGSYITEGHFA